MEELKKAQELRVDEFSFATMHELPSQIQELQEKVNHMKDSKEFQDIESICSGKFSHVPSRQSFQVLEL